MIAALPNGSVSYPLSRFILYQYKETPYLLQRLLHIFLAKLRPSCLTCDPTIYITTKPVEEGHMQTNQHHIGGAVHQKLEPNPTAMFSFQGDWKPSYHGEDPAALADPLGLSIQSASASQSQYPFDSDIRHAGTSVVATGPTHPSPESAPSGGFDYGACINDHPPSAWSATGPESSAHPSFMALNATDIKPQETFGMSPLQTLFDNAPSTYGSSTSFSAGGSIHSPADSNFGQWPDGTEQVVDGQKKRREGIAGRRRRSENVEPGSARAIYLEKNRKAASKCRTKQKKQQEELVQAARDQQRRNKVLKTEVEHLKSDLRDLMELVGVHNECPDQRLKRYVQLEADRLASRGDASPVAQLLSPKSSPKGGGSPEKSA